CCQIERLAPLLVRSKAGVGRLFGSGREENRLPSFVHEDLAVAALGAIDLDFGGVEGSRFQNDTMLRNTRGNVVTGAGILDSNLDAKLLAGLLDRHADGERALP